MDNGQITLMIEALLEKRKKPAKEVADIDIIINDLRSKLSNTPIVKSDATRDLEPKPVYLSNSLFPTSGGLQLQVLAALDFHKKPLKMQQISDTIKGQTGREFDIRETVRGMNKSFLLILMKINNSNKNSYWIKQDWYDKATKSLKEEYKFEDMDVLYDPAKIEFIGVKK